MKAIVFLALYLFTGPFLLGQPKQRKVIFVIVDGIPADVIEKVATPHLDSIARTGTYTRAYVGGQQGAYSQSPTISAVGYNSLLTGTWANKHNVWDNDIQAPNYQYWNIFRLLKAAQPEKKTAVFSSWLDNRTKLVGDGLPAAGSVRVDFAFDGYEHDTVQFPHDPERNFMRRIDERVVDEAVHCLKHQAPDLSWVYLEYTDDMGHRHGDGEPFYRAVRGMDGQMGRLAQAIRYREQHYPEEWLLLITTDHGRDRATGKNHGGQSERERTTWLVTSAAQLNSYAAQGPVAIVDLYPTIARFMHLPVPVPLQRELDGVPLIGPVSLARPRVTRQANQLTLAWHAFGQKGQVKIWLATGNQFKNGQSDAYQLVSQVPLSRQQATLSLPQPGDDFYKVWLEGPDNGVNLWVPAPN